MRREEKPVSELGRGFGRVVKRLVFKVAISFWADYVPALAQRV
jgi:hypothetical protein